MTDEEAMVKYNKEAEETLAADVSKKETIEGVNIFYMKEDLTDGDVYDWSQCYDPIEDGDLFVLHDGRVVVMDKAWPVMIHGGSKALHTYVEGHDWGNDYPKTKIVWERIKNSLPKIDPNQVFPDESPYDKY